jgi:hypothetical protein
LESVAVTVKLVEAVLVGVPVSAPAELSVRPTGSVPLETVNV